MSYKKVICYKKAICINKWSPEKIYPNNIKLYELYLIEEGFGDLYTHTPVKTLDNIYLGIFPKESFKDIQEYRNEKINEILNEL